MASLQLVIGTKRLSSWSMRPWLVLKRSGLPFEEVLVELDRPTTAEELGRRSPSGKVPALHHGALCVWDSLAICEYVHELAPRQSLWPEAAEARAVARAVSAEMHSGFGALREAFPMNTALRTKAQASAKVLADIQRIVSLWEDCRRRFGAGGPFLFGAFSIADAMFAPVVSRFVSYGVELEGAAAEYARTWQEDAAYREWTSA